MHYSFEKWKVQLQKLLKCFDAVLYKAVEFVEFTTFPCF